MLRLILALLLLAPMAARAQSTVRTIPMPQAPSGPSQMGLGVVTATALTYPAGTTTAVCTVEGQSVRYRDDGTAPTATVGTLLPIGTFVTLRLRSLSNATWAQFIQTAATATLDCSYYAE